MTIIDDLCTDLSCDSFKDYIYFDDNIGGYVIDYSDNSYNDISNDLQNFYDKLKSKNQENLVDAMNIFYNNPVDNYDIKNLNNKVILSHGQNESSKQSFIYKYLFLIIKVLCFCLLFIFLFLRIYPYLKKNNIQVSQNTIPQEIK